MICAAVVESYGLDASALRSRHDPHLARAVATWLCRRHSEAFLQELAVCFNLSRAASVPNLTRRLEASLKRSPRLARDLPAIMRLVTTQAPGGNGGGRHTPHRRRGKKSKQRLTPGLKAKPTRHEKEPPTRAATPTQRQRLIMVASGKSAASSETVSDSCTPTLLKHKRGRIGYQDPGFASHRHHPAGGQRS